VKRPYIIPCGPSLECQAAGAQNGPGAEHAIYGGGVFVPGFNFDQLYRSWNMEQIVAVAGVIFADEHVTWRADVRKRFGDFLRALDVPIYVADDLSLEWSAHFGLQDLAQDGPRLAWRMPRALKDDVTYADSVGAAIGAICDGCVPVCALPKRAQLTEQFHDLFRFAEQYSLHDLVAHSREEWENITERVKANFKPYQGRLMALAERESARVDHFLAQFSVEPVDNVVALEDVLSDEREYSPEIGATIARAARAALPRRRRRLEFGSVFDPKTHYTEDYYEGSAGIEYWHNDPNMDGGGEWRLYHGTTCDHWAGNEVLAQFLFAWLKGRHIVDLGCSSGDFLFCAKELANARSVLGLELSDAAFKFANPSVAPHLHIRNIIDDPLEDKADVLTAWDVWEHIYYGDVDELMQAVRLNLRDGGLHFAKICTHMLNEQQWEIEPGAVVTKENSWLLVSGHVLIKSWAWWAQKFAEHGLVIDWQVTGAFNIRRSEHPLFSQDKSWESKNFFALRAV
jgi:SAM-dependent methyltransferase